MANILFISVNDTTALGVRALSAMLKQHGHDARIVFLKEYQKVDGESEADDWVGIKEDGTEFRFARGPEVSPVESALLLELIGVIQPDLIGFSVTTPIRKRCAEITRRIKETYRIPIVWGGPDPTMNPEVAANFSDFVHIGEGDITILKIASALARKEDLNSINNLAYMDEGRLIKNPLEPLVTDLDSLPFMDISPLGKYLIENDALVENFGEASYSGNVYYHTSSSRGCPYNCSFCCENYYKQMYAPQRFLRRRSPQNVVDELTAARRVIVFQKVRFEDEVFSFDLEWLDEFNDLYKKEIGLPLVCYIYPNSNIRQQLEILKDTGLIFTCLALQSGSARINRDVFNRPFDRELYIQTAYLLRSMGISFSVDVITNNPFEREPDIRATLSILNELPKPYNLSVNKLYVLKGTKIHSLIEEYKRTGGRSLPQKYISYYSCLFWLASRYDKWIVRLISGVRVFKYISAWHGQLNALACRLERLGRFQRKT